jgi:hypothetical protein
MTSSFCPSDVMTTWVGPGNTVGHFPLTVKFGGCLVSGTVSLYRLDDNGKEFIDKIVVTRVPSVIFIVEHAGYYTVEVNP